jgi:hypothetical protein
MEIRPLPLAALMADLGRRGNDIGGFLGLFMGFAWYEFIEVPKAASMNSMAAETYLCAAGSALPLLAVPGAILSAIIVARNGQAVVHGKGQRQPQ